MPGVLPLAPFPVGGSSTGSDFVIFKVDASGRLEVIQGVAGGATIPFSVRLSDGAVFYDAAKSTQFPAALSGGRLDVTATQNGVWAVTANVGTTGGLALEATLATMLTLAGFQARINTLGQKAMAASTPIVIASDQSTLNVQGTKSNNGGVPGAINFGALPAIANAANPSYTEGNQVGLSVALNGILRTDNSTWFGSTAPTVGQKTMANSIPVTFASDQTALPVTFTTVGARNGVSSGKIALGGSTANTLQVMRATAYVEPAAAAQRSISSANANDTAAGTGARTVAITYYDNTGVGPLVETVTLNGTTAVNTVATNIRFIERMQVLTVGSTGANVGIITLFTATAGGGSAIGTIGTGNILVGAGDRETLWAHHYVATGYKAELAVVISGIISGGSGTNGVFFLRGVKPLVTDASELFIGDQIISIGTFERSFDYHPTVVGFTRVTLYVIPGTNNATATGAFDWSEVPV